MRFAQPTSANSLSLAVPSQTKTLCQATRLVCRPDYTAPRRPRGPSSIARVHRFDSGATNHMTFDRANLANIR